MDNPAPIHRTASGSWKPPYIEDNAMLIRIFGDRTSRDLPQGLRRRHQRRPAPPPPSRQVHQDQPRTLTGTEVRVNRIGREQPEAVISFLFPIHAWAFLNRRTSPQVVRNVEAEENGGSDDMPELEDTNELRL